MPRNAMRAGLHLARNASGLLGAVLAPVDALGWAVNLAGDAAKQSVTWLARHQRAVADVARIAGGLLPIEPAALTWALKIGRAHV